MKKEDYINLGATDLLNKAVKESNKAEKKINGEELLSPANS